MSSLAPYVLGNTLTLDKTRSVIEVNVKTTVGTFTSKFATFIPELSIDPVHGKVTGAVHFTMTDLKSNNDDRDMEIYMWLRTDKFPKADFVLDHVTSDLKTGASQAQGRLTINSVEREVSFPLTVTIKNKIMTMEGTSALDTRDYGLPIYRKFFIFSAEPLTSVHFKLIGSVSQQ